jgi:hypothetical protein
MRSHVIVEQCTAHHLKLRRILSLTEAIHKDVHHGHSTRPYTWGSVKPKNPVPSRLRVSRRVTLPLLKKLTGRKSNYGSFS